MPERYRHKPYAGMTIQSKILIAARQAYSLLPAALTAVLAIGLAVLSRISQPLNPKIIDTHVNILGLQSTRLQFILYGQCVVTLLGSTVVILLAKNWARFKPEKQDIHVEKATGWTLAAILLLLSISTTGNYRLPFFVAFAVGLPLLSLLVSDPGRRKWIKLAAVAACIAYLAGAYLIPLIYQYPISSVGGLVSHETHHAVTVLPGVDIARGQKLENPGGYYYGFLLPAGVSITSWLTGVSPSDPLITVRTVQLFNVLASLLVATLAYLQLPRGWKWLTLLSLPLLPSLSLAHSSISHPNQAGIRYITLLVALLVMTAIDRRQQRNNTWILGTFGGLLMAINLELGLCINAGFITYTIVNSLHRKTGWTKGLVIYSLPALVAFMAISWSTIEGFTSSGNLSSLGYFVSMFGGSGYGGLVSAPSFLAVAIFFASSLIVTKEALLISSEYEQNKIANNAFSCGIAMMILAWLPYYVNRMSEWNLWIIPLLLFLMVINYREGGVTKTSQKNIDLCLSPSILFPLVLATTFTGVLESAASTLGYARRLKANDCSITSLSGSTYCMSEDIVSRTRNLDIFLSAQKDKKSDYLILSPFHDNQARIAGFNSQFPWHAAMGAITVDEVKAQSKWIDDQGPAFLLVPIPDESDSNGTNERIRHLKLIANGASAYSMVDVKGGWSFYQRK